MEGFIPHIIGNTETTAFEYLPAKKQTADYVVGQALVWDDANGYLDIASGAVTPEYFAYTNGNVADDKDPLCVTRVRDDIIYETHAAAAMTGIDIGSMVTIATAGATYPNGVRVSNITSGGTATIVGYAPVVVGGTTIAAEGAAGCKVYVKFEI